MSCLKAVTVTRPRLFLPLLFSKCGSPECSHWSGIQEAAPQHTDPHPPDNEASCFQAVWWRLGLWTWIKDRQNFKTDISFGGVDQEVLCITIYLSGSLAWRGAHSLAEYVVRTQRTLLSSLPESPEMIVQWRTNRHPHHALEEHLHSTVEKRVWGSNLLCFM